MTDLPPPEARPPPPPHLSAPLRDLAAWTRYFRDAEIPVLAATSRALEELRANEDDVDAGMLNAVIQTDPLMTLKVLAHVSGKRRAGDVTETETITSSLVMMGISPFSEISGCNRRSKTGCMTSRWRCKGCSSCSSGPSAPGTLRPALRCTAATWMPA